MQHIIPSKISVEEMNSLKKLISLEEFCKLISTLSKDKAPSLDNLPIEFYKVNFEWIDKDLL